MLGHYQLNGSTFNELFPIYWYTLSLKEKNGLIYYLLPYSLVVNIYIFNYVLPQFKKYLYPTSMSMGTYLFISFNQLNA
jgi:hypothetical protein